MKGNARGGTVMSSRTEMTNGQRVELLARAARVTCARMTSAQLAEIHVRALHGSIEQACRTPASFGWEPQAAMPFLRPSWELAEIPVRALPGSWERACRTPASFGWEPQAASLVLALSWPFLRTWQAILAEYEARYNGRRPHRGRSLRPPQPDHPVADLSRKRIQRRRVLGGPHQRVRAGRIEAQARASGRVLEP